MKLGYDRDLQYAYKVILDEVVGSNEYLEFTKRITETDGFKTAFYKLSRNKNKSLKALILESFSDVNFMRALAFSLNKEDEFCETVLSSIKDENILNRVIKTKLLETFYGNPKKEDLNHNDAIYMILESIFGLDTLIVSVTDNKAIEERFYNVMKEVNRQDFEEFANIINRLYADLRMENDYEKIKTIVRGYRSELISYIYEGLNIQNKEIMNNPNGTYFNYHILFDNIKDLVGNSNSKIM